MTDNFNVSITLTGNLFDPQKIQQATKESIENTGAFLLAELFLLANSGKNADNQPLQPYSAWYQAIRQNKGLSLAPNFQFTSSMLNSLTIMSKNDNSFIIGVIGIDVNGMSNALKLQKTQQIKNYYLLRATVYLSNKVAKFFEGQLISKLTGV